MIESGAVRPARWQDRIAEEPWARPALTGAVAVAIAVALGWAAVTYPTQFMVGLIVGSVYGLAALGLTLIYGITKVAHFAHGDSMMLCAYLVAFALTGAVISNQRRDVHLPFRIDQLPGATDGIWRFSFGYGFLLSMLIMLPIAIAMFLAIDRMVYKPLQSRGATVAFIAVASLGVAISMRGLMLLIWGPTPRKYSTGIRPTIELGPLPRMVADQYFILLTSVAVTILATWLLYRTTLGTAMRAMADNADLARTCGIVTKDVARWTWVIGGALIFVAGTLLALQSQLTPELGFVLLLPIFAAMILGGVGSPPGALLGGLIIGLVSEISVGMGFIGSGYKIAIAFAVLIAVIVIRPRGLFGAKD